MEQTAGSPGLASRAETSCGHVRTTKPLQQVSRPKGLLQFQRGKAVCVSEGRGTSEVGE